MELVKPPSLKSLRVPFGERRGRLFTPDQVDRGLACQCRCPACHTPLVANKPKVRRHYFSHHRSEECPGGYETALHLMGKQIIEQARRVTLPQHQKHLVENVAGARDLHDVVVFPMRDVELRDVVSEKQAGRWRPDLTATLKNGETLYIEIRVTHAVEEEKSRGMDNLMEIDLSGVEPEVVLDIDALTRAVLSSAPRHWYRVSLFDNLQRLARAREALEREAQAKRRQLEKEAAKKQQKKLAWEHRIVNRDAMREKYDRDIQNILKMTKPRIREQFEQSMRQRCEEGIQQMKRRLQAHTEGDQELPFGVAEIMLPNAWIVRTDPLIWKAFVLERFIIQRQVGESVTVDEVVGETARQYGYIEWLRRLLMLKSESKERYRRNDWGESKGVWFLSETENKAIKTPYGLALSYLTELSGPPFHYLESVREGAEYRILDNQPLVRYRAVEKARKEQAERDQMKEEADLAAAQRHADSEKQMMLHKVDVLYDLVETGIKEAGCCSFCHILSDDLEQSRCTVCQSGVMEPVTLTPSYINSYPYRLLSKPQRRI